MIAQNISHKISQILLSLTVIFFIMLMPWCTQDYIIGKVIDAKNGQPVNYAEILTGNGPVTPDKNGIFYLKRQIKTVSIMARGYETVSQRVVHPFKVTLEPFTPKALYLSFFGIGSQKILNGALKLIDETELNAVVIDIKGDRAMIPYKSSIPLAAEIGAQKMITVRDVKALMDTFKSKGIYTIARIVTFKDNLLISAKPELGIRNESGGLYVDREKLYWADPFRKAVWDYNLAIAEEAARLGFNEIQFDYVRFPDTYGLKFALPNTEENRVAAITAFLKEAKERLRPYKVFLSADVFGYVNWHGTDIQIGQKLEQIAGVVDYVCPMLYPSGFSQGIPGYKNPVQNPYEIVYLSLKEGKRRTGLPAVNFRPWIQAFKDYAFDRRFFDETEIKAQIKAADDFGSHGWMLWNARNIYSTKGLKLVKTYDTTQEN